MRKNQTVYKFIKDEFNNYKYDEIRRLITTIKRWFGDILVVIRPKKNKLK
jgi:hypothetical protein